MTRIKHYVDEIKEELAGAKNYAETYVDNKVRGSSSLASRYKQMSLDELQHASNIHEEAVRDIADIENAVEVPEAMRERWNKAHAEYVEAAALVKQMLLL